MNEIILAGYFFLGGITVTIIGSLFADWRNHKRSLERLKEEHKKKIDYMKREKIFDKKLQFLINFSSELERKISNLSCLAYFCEKKGYNKEKEEILNEEITYIKNNFSTFRGREILFGGEFSNFLLKKDDDKTKIVNEIVKNCRSINKKEDNEIIKKNRELITELIKISSEVNNKIKEELKEITSHNP